MCKKSIAAEIRGETGRISEIRVNKDNVVVCTFTGRGCSTSRTVAVTDVKPANQKAAKHLDEALQAFKNLKKQQTSLKTGEKASPKK